MSKSLPNSDDSILEAKLQDAVELCFTKNRAHFVGFLDEREAVLAQEIMKRCSCKNYMLWGGYEASERVVFGVFPDYMAPESAAFPIMPLTAVFRECDTLTHRDFLGALMNAGIQRDTLGDILVEAGRCVLFTKPEIAQYLLLQITKIGRVGVKLTEVCRNRCRRAETSLRFQRLWLHPDLTALLQSQRAQAVKRQVR
jgi:RNA-binding protein YlmH